MDYDVLHRKVAIQAKIPSGNLAGQQQLAGSRHRRLPQLHGGGR